MKLITQHDLAKIVAKLLTGPVKDGGCGELDESDQYSRFVTDVAQLVCDYCGGEVRNIATPLPSGDMGVWFVGIRGNDSSPEDGGVWADFNQEGDLWDLEKDFGSITKVEHVELPGSTMSSATRFVQRVSRLSIWDWSLNGAHYAECEEPSDGYEDSHSCLMALIEQARVIQAEPTIQKTMIVQDEVPCGTTGRLVSLDGIPIDGTLESVPGLARIISATRQPDGSLDIDYDGQTDLEWNDQESITDANGEKIFVTMYGQPLPASQVKLIAEI